MDSQKGGSYLRMEQEQISLQDVAFPGKYGHKMQFDEPLRRSPGGGCHHNLGVVAYAFGGSCLRRKKISACAATVFRHDFS